MEFRLVWFCRAQSDLAMAGRLCRQDRDARAMIGIAWRWWSMEPFCRMRANPAAKAGK